MLFLMSHPPYFILAFAFFFEETFEEYDIIIERVLTPIRVTKTFNVYNEEVAATAEV